MAKINDVCKTMINQIGGGRAATMVGGRYLYDNEKNTVTFSFKGSKHSNHMRIVYDEGKDLYNIKFIKTWGTKYTEKSEFIGVYCDMIKEIFETTTGLYLSL